RLYGEADDDRVAIGDAAEDATGVVRLEARSVVAGAHLVGVLGAGERRGAHALADLDALDGVDRHHRSGEVGAELAVDRGAPAGRHAFSYDLDHRADGVAILADGVEIRLPFGGRLGVGAEERIVVDFGPIEIGIVDLVRPHLHEAAADGDVGDDL